MGTPQESLNGEEPRNGTDLLRLFEIGTHLTNLAYFDKTQPNYKTEVLCSLGALKASLEIQIEKITKA